MREAPAISCPECVDDSHDITFDDLLSQPVKQTRESIGSRSLVIGQAHDDLSHFGFGEDVFQVTKVARWQPNQCEVEPTCMSEWGSEQGVVVVIEALRELGLGDDLRGSAPTTQTLSILFFLPLWQACRWKNLVLASPSLRYVIRERCLAIVLASEASPRVLSFSEVCRSRSCGVSALASSAISKPRMVSRAKANCRRTLPTLWLLQLRSALATCLNLLSSFLQGATLVSGCAQAS